MTTVKIPTDSLFHVSSLSVSAEHMTPRYVPGIAEPMYELNSSYRLKGGELLACDISAIHPAWYYSGLDFNSPFIEGSATFRANALDKGETAFIEIANPKLLSKTSTLASEECMTGVNFDENIPVSYSGFVYLDRPVPSVLGAHCTSANVNFTVIAPTEIEIKVTAPLTEEVHFSFPVSSPRLGYITIWGQTGEESTLPTGAVLGLVKVKTEVKFASALGQWKNEAVKKLLCEPTHYFQQEQFRVGGRINVAPDNPAWFDDLRDTLELTPHYVALENWLDGEDTEFYKLGYQHMTATVGTGIFVFQTNKVGTIPWAQVTEGYNTRRNVTADTLGDTVTLEETLDMSEFRQNFLAQIQATGGGLTSIPAQSILPVCAADLQVEKRADVEFFASISAPASLYPLHTPQRAMQVTPLYIPQQGGYHCWAPAQTYRQAYRLHNLQGYNLEESTNLWLKGDNSFLNITDVSTTSSHTGGGGELPSGDVPMRFHNSHEIPVTSWAEAISSCAPYLKSKFGFTMRRHRHDYWQQAYTGWSGYWRMYADFRANWGFINEPTTEFTIGVNSTTANPTVIPVHPYMTTMCIGKLAAGTATGTYLFKPFASYSKVLGALDAKGSKFAKVETTGDIKGDRTILPYWGLNIITISTSFISWTIG